MHDRRNVAASSCQCQNLTAIEIRNSPTHGAMTKNSAESWQPRADHRDSVVQNNSHGTLVPECPCLMCKSPYLPHVLLSVIQSSTPLMNMDSCLAHVRSVSRKKHTEHPISLDHLQVEARWLAFDSFSGCQKAQPQIRAKRTWTVTKLESKMGSCKYTH